MKYLIFLAVALLGLKLFFRRPNYSLPDLSEEEIAAVLEADAKAQEESQALLQKLVVYRTLRDSIQDGMTLSQMIDAFEKMCEISVGDPDHLLFETGTYDFTGEKMFHFDLVRQFKFMDPDEYVQLHLEVLYTPSLKTALLHRTTWAAPEDGTFFETVKSSRDYMVVKDLPIAKVHVHIDET